MQYYENGYYPGDPGVAPDPVERSIGLPERVDVLIVGCGPAGLVLAAQLAAFPGITTRIVERKDGPLELGQADGIACRTVEMFQSFGLASRLLDEAHWVNETVFWGPSEGNRGEITRTGRVKDTEEGVSEFPHVIVNQARVQGYLLELMRKSRSRLEPDYGVEFVDLTVEEDDEHPVLVTLRKADGTLTSVRAQYVVGCDGARSAVRHAIGRDLKGDSANQAWGVIDVLARTDFPDIRHKAVIQSAAEGNIVLIPREGGYLVRLYIELDELSPGERVSARAMTAEVLIDAARRIINPYALDVSEVVWWSVYEIGQRLTDKFDNSDDLSVHPRVFIAGDACHTHSPKAGQGMNVSMQDAFNLGWKLASVVTGRSLPALLHTYSLERQAIASDLIEFDREWSRIVSTPPADPARPEDGGTDPEVVRRYFAQSGRYTAGVATRYDPSVITGDGEHQALASGFLVGERFHSAPVLRLADAKPLQLGHVALADGRWRLYAFGDAGPITERNSRLHRFCETLLDPSSSPILPFLREGDALDAVLDLRVVLQEPAHLTEIGDLPPVLKPRKGKLDLVDYEKVFCVDSNAGDIYDLRGIDRDKGCMVLVRPDQYVAQVLPLEAVEELRAFLAGILSMTVLDTVQ